MNTQFRPPNLFVLDLDFNRLGFIHKYSALIWTPRYSEAGDFRVVLPCNKEDWDILKEGNIILKSGTDEGAIIQDVFITLDGEGRELINCEGEMLSAILRDRIIMSTETFNKVPGDIAMASLVNQNASNIADNDRGFPTLEPVSDKVSNGKEVSFQVTYDNLLETITRISKESGIGFYISVDTEGKALHFKTYKGIDRTAGQSENERAIFSKHRGNISNQEYSRYTSNFKNVAIIAAEGEGEEREIQVINNEARGFERKELYVDARDLQRTYSEDGEEVTLPEEEYLQLMISRGEAKLSEYDKVITFESEIDIFSQVTREMEFNLGDIVTVQNKDWGVSIDSRLIEISEVYEKDHVGIDAVFGSDVPTIVDKLKRAVGK